MFVSTSLFAKNSSVNENISKESFSTFSFQMPKFLIKAPILDFSVKILVLSPWRDKLSSLVFQTNLLSSILSAASYHWGNGGPILNFFLLEKSQLFLYFQYFAFRSHNILFNTLPFESHLISQCDKRVVNSDSISHKFAKTRVLFARL